MATFRATLYRLRLIVAICTYNMLKYVIHHTIGFNFSIAY